MGLTSVGQLAVMSIDMAGLWMLLLVRSVIPDSHAYSSYFSYQLCIL